MRARRSVPPALRLRDFSVLVAAVVGSRVSAGIVAVAVGWQVYDIRHSALDLGLIGLAEFAPLPLLALPAGHFADRLPRRLVFATSLVVHAAVALALLAVTLAGADRLWPFLALAALGGVATAFGTPAMRALPPAYVPVELLPGAFALRSIAQRGASVVGPAIGGFVFAASAPLVYALAAAVLLVSVLLAATLPERAVERAEVAEPPPPLGNLLAGIRFIRQTPVLLGAITLDLFAVLFGGAVALLPLFAQSILHVGPGGLGILRSMPAIGGIAAAAILTQRSVGARAGRTLLVVVAVFGVSMIVFGLSRSFVVSAVALAASGFADMISVNIRSTIVALATPDELRGRVLAVEMVFISASNELGAFESGVAAALIGAVPAVVVGGVVTVALALVWFRVFPALADVGRLEHLRPIAAGGG